jgi:hypothetical protein
MWLRILEGAFGFLFVLGVVTQIIWPLLTDTALYPSFRKNSRQQKTSDKSFKTLADEHAIEGEIIDHPPHQPGDRS